MKKIFTFFLPPAITATLMIVLFIMFGFVNNTSAQKVAVTTWTGGAFSTDWFAAGNWSNGVPTSSHQVIIPSTPLFYPIIELKAGTGATCASLTINAGGKLDFIIGASLITSGAISNGGTITTYAAVPPNSKWHYISSPLTNAFSGMFDGNYLQSWDEPTGLWTEIVPSDTPLVPAQGYGFWSIGGGVYSSVGTFNTGPQSIALSYQNAGVYKGMNLVGNPYPSAIDWDMLYTTYGTAYLWSPSPTPGGGDYIEWTGPSGGLHNIATFQGFFIYTEDDNAVFSLNNGHRVHNNGYAYKSGNEVNLTSGMVLTASTGDYADELTIKIDGEAAEGFELPRDAWKLISDGEGVSQLYTFSSDGKLAIDVRPYQETIQLGFVNNKAGDYEIGAKAMADISSAIIEDTKLNQFHNLANGSYAFNWQTDDSEERFILHLSVTGTSDLDAQEAQVYGAYGQVYVRMNTTNTFTQMAIYDLSGRLILEKPLQGESLQSFELNQPCGAYLVQLRGEENSKSYKIVL